MDGLWQPSATGIVKGSTLTDTPAALLIKIPPRTFDTFGMSDVTMNVRLCLSIRYELCPTGRELLEYTEPIQNIVTEWNMKQTGEELEDFEVDGFFPGGLMVNGGTGPDLDLKNKSWSVEWDITLKGALVAPLA